jgi:hypothetical protein
MWTQWTSVRLFERRSPSIEIAACMWLTAATIHSGLDETQDIWAGDSQTTKMIKGDASGRRHFE